MVIFTSIDVQKWRVSLERINKHNTVKCCDLICYPGKKTNLMVQISQKVVYLPHITNVETKDLGGFLFEGYQISKWLPYRISKWSP